MRTLRSSPLTLSVRNKITVYKELLLTRQEEFFYMGDCLQRRVWQGVKTLYIVCADFAVYESLVMYNILIGNSLAVKVKRYFIGDFSRYT